MANSNKDLKDFVLNKENVFEMKFNEFQSLFLSKLRSHDEVKCLYDVIQERENEKKKRVKENLKEFVEEAKDVELPSMEDILESMTRLKENLAKDMEVFDDDIQSSYELMNKYIDYLRDEAEEMIKDSSVAPTNVEEEFKSFIEDI